MPRQEVWRCMREKWVPEKYVMIVQDMYEWARALVKSSVGITDMIPVGVGRHQWSSLSPNIFAMLMDVLARGIKDLSPWCMLYADDIVLCVTSSEVVEKKLKSGEGLWKTDGWRSIEIKWFNWGSTYMGTWMETQISIYRDIGRKWRLGCGDDA